MHLQLRTWPNIGFELFTSIYFLKYIYPTSPSVLLNRCSKDYNNGRIISMSSDRIEQIKKVNQTMAEKALRVLAVAYQDVSKVPNKNIAVATVSAQVENNLIFVRTNWNDRPTKRRSKRGS